MYSALTAEGISTIIAPNPQLASFLADFAIFSKLIKLVAKPAFRNDVDIFPFPLQKDLQIRCIIQLPITLLDVPDNVTGRPSFSLPSLPFAPSKGDYYYTLLQVVVKRKGLKQ
jgi:hypothetical protein